MGNGMVLTQPVKVIIRHRLTMWWKTFYKIYDCKCNIYLERLFCKSSCSFLNHLFHSQLVHLVPLRSQLELLAVMIQI